MNIKALNKNAVATIVKCFAVLAKSNNVLMIDSFEKEERQNVQITVRNFRQQYQQLLSAVSLAFDVNSRSRSQTSVDRNSTSQSLVFMKSLTQTQRESQSTISEKQDERSARAAQYRNDKKRSNVHANLYYDMMNDEYELSSHCNILIDEDKHRFFKKIVYQINHSNVKKTMLLRENLEQIVRLLLMNNLAHAESETTNLIKKIHNNCSSLFITLLSRFEQMQLKDDDFESRVTIVQNNDHLQSKSIDCLKLKYCREILKLSTRSFENTAVMSSSFKVVLRNAYQLDYDVSFRLNLFLCSC